MSEPPREREIVLLVDDNPTNLAVLQRILKEAPRLGLGRVAGEGLVGRASAGRLSASERYSLRPHRSESQ